LSSVVSIFIDLYRCFGARRVEIIDQRIHDIEDLVGDARQNQNLIKVFSDATSFKRLERVESAGKFDHKITDERRDETEGNVF